MNATEIREEIYLKRKELNACFNANDKNRFYVVQDELKELQRRLEQFTLT